MDVILGIDIGGSTTKIVGLRTDGSVISMLRVRAEDQVTSLYRRPGQLSHQQPADSLRGCAAGSAHRRGRLLMWRATSTVCPPVKWASSPPAAPEPWPCRASPRAVVVSMGTGTAFLWASPDGIRHLCGSGIGGGTLGGLCHKLVGMERFGQIKKLAGERQI